MSSDKKEDHSLLSSKEIEEFQITHLITTIEVREKEKNKRVQASHPGQVIDAQEKLITEKNAVIKRLREQCNLTEHIREILEKSLLNTTKLPYGILYYLPKNPPMPPDF